MCNCTCKCVSIIIYISIYIYIYVHIYNYIYIYLYLYIHSHFLVFVHFLPIFYHWNPNICRSNSILLAFQDPNWCFFKVGYPQIRWCTTEPWLLQHTDSNLCGFGGSFLLFSIVKFPWNTPYIWLVVSDMVHIFLPTFLSPMSGDPSRSRNTFQVASWRVSVQIPRAGRPPWRMGHGRLRKLSNGWWSFCAFAWGSTWEFEDTHQDLVDLDQFWTLLWYFHRPESGGNPSRMNHDCGGEVMVKGILLLLGGFWRCPHFWLCLVIVNQPWPAYRSLIRTFPGGLLLQKSLYSI